MEPSSQHLDALAYPAGRARKRKISTNTQTSPCQSNPNVLTKSPSETLDEHAYPKVTRRRTRPTSSAEIQPPSTTDSASDINYDAVFSPLPRGAGRPKKNGRTRAIPAKSRARAAPNLVNQSPSSAAPIIERTATPCLKGKGEPKPLAEPVKSKSTFNAPPKPSLTEPITRLAAYRDSVEEKEATFIQLDPKTWVAEIVDASGSRLVCSAPLCSRISDPLSDWCSALDSYPMCRCR